MGYDVPMERYQPPHEIPAGFESVPDLSTIPLVGQIACGEPILAEENVGDEGAVYVAEGPKKFLKNFCKTP